MNIDFPYHVDQTGRTAATGYDAHVRDMIEQLLFTSPGERVNRHDFGSGLRQLIFAPNSRELAAALQFTIQASLQQWLGDIIEVAEVRAESYESEIRIAIVYSVLRTRERQTAVFTRSV
ncbi:MAG TPA: GPW/gp25 family protein [Pyrinomonadaceae bacterium]|nr:GPW/gp25 family protein [Pyrinomonadaceae bacterium]